MPKNTVSGEGTKTIERDAHVKDEQNIPVTQDTISPETTGDVTLGEVAGEVAGDTTNAPVDELSGEGPLYRVIYRYAFRSNKPFWVLDECDDDLVSNISQYNQKYRNKRLPRIVLIFDEFGAMRDQNKVGDESKVGDAVESVLANLVEMGRSAGIHCILATQTATTKVICGRIKNNAGAKLAFNCSNIEGSKAILGNGGAVNLFTKGRAILDFNRTVEVQTPKMTDDILMETIEGAKTGQFQALQARHDVTPQEVMQYALEKHSGKLALQGDNGIYTFFRSRGISRDELAEWFESWEGNEYVVNDVLYKVSPNSGSQPRRLVAVEVDNKTI